jgi:hypothetical protein
MNMISSPQTGTLIPVAVALGFKKGPQYLLFNVLEPCPQDVLDPAKMWVKGRHNF